MKKIIKRTIGWTTIIGGTLGIFIALSISEGYPWYLGLLILIGFFSIVVGLAFFLNWCFEN